MSEPSRKPLIKETDKNREWLRTIKFTLFSISAGILQALTFTFLQEVVHLESVLPNMSGYEDFGASNLIALLVSVIWNFTINRKYTFRSDAPLKRSMLLTLLFYLFFTPLSVIGGTELVQQFGWNKYIVQGITMLANFVLEFLWQRFVVYRDRVDTAKKS